MLAAVLAIAGCVGPPEDLAAGGDPGVGEDESVTPAPVRGYSWVVDGRLAGMARPGTSGGLDGELMWLAEEQGITLLVSLTEVRLPPEALARAGLEGMHLPVKDFTAPEIAQLQAFVAEVGRRHAGGEAVGVHCGAGLGRTGTFLAAWFVSRGMTAPDAIAEVRRVRPGSIETHEQEAVVGEYWDVLRRARALEAPASR